MKPITANGVYVLYANVAARQSSILMPLLMIAVTLSTVTMGLIIAWSMMRKRHLLALLNVRPMQLPASQALSVPQNVIVGTGFDEAPKRQSR